MQNSCENNIRLRKWLPGKDVPQSHVPMKKFWFRHDNASAQNYFLSQKKKSEITLFIHADESR